MHGSGYVVQICFTFWLSVAAAQALPVFPGAEGYGTQTRAGRGGRLITVTSLADAGPGSLREALDQPEPRIIVFKVGGLITLEDKLYIHHPFVTIAGQTAPGGGIALRDFGLVIAAHDVLVQHLRVRPGNQGDTEGAANDAIEILGNEGNEDVNGAYNVVIDHVSASWAEDEVISTWFGAHDVTVSWSIISEGLNRARHRKGEHSSGMVVGGKSDRVSLHHNLFAHNHSRNPLIKFGGTHEIVGNVIYDWRMLATDVVDDEPTSVNIMRNHYLPGPSTQLVQEIVIERHGGAHIPQLHVYDNSGPNLPAPRDDPWRGVFVDFSMTRAPPVYREMNPFPTPLAETTGSDSEHDEVLRQAGASLPQRDDIDSRIVSDVQQNRGGIIDSPAQVGGYPQYLGGTPELDNDSDGMPDSWELEVGLDPNDPGDGNGDTNGDGYTHIEEYLFSLRP